MYLKRGLLAGPGRATRRYYAASYSYGRLSLFLCCGILLIVYLAGLNYHTGLQQESDEDLSYNHEQGDGVNDSFYKLPPANSTLGVSATCSPTPCP
jgi:hypothetical protein